MHPHTVRVFQSKFRVSPVTCCLPPRPLSAGVVALATGVHHTCALLMGGGAVCWGDNQEGQLGTGDMTNKLTPTAVAGLGTGEGRIDQGSLRGRSGQTASPVRVCTRVSSLLSLHIRT
jgi:alpha-tubulin suppressor-like RCC1 family protein